MKTDNNVFKQR